MPSPSQVLHYNFIHVFFYNLGNTYKDIYVYRYIYLYKPHTWSEPYLHHICSKSSQIIQKLTNTATRWFSIKSFWLKLCAVCSVSLKTTRTKEEEQYLTVVLRLLLHAQGFITEEEAMLSKGNRRNRLRYAKYTITGWKEVREHPHSSQWCWRSS